MASKLSRATAAYEAKWRAFYDRCLAAGADPVEAVVLATKVATAEGKVVQTVCREIDHARDRRLFAGGRRQ